MTRTIRLTLAGCALLLLAGCQSDSRGIGDSPVGKNDKAPAEIITFPDSFPNVATKCDGHGHRIFVTTHDKSDSPPTVVLDPTCPGAKAS